MNNEIKELLFCVVGVIVAGVIAGIIIMTTAF